ncbi:putative phosphosugar-binding protein [Saccharomonospora amisosensis]|uniref:Putative phosphosugar-binding protein n=1 Tax=Saccharomonospora amisosensis TaxID=1128677 RepID=A0A7X5ULH2_9PSEU|nr:sugar isomerase domain-containing protein [Saccharomonospora amisosensis]NIJ10185.1 putative phosphosugar-binding protein [Saccharomonospora amisosensis]
MRQRVRALLDGIDARETELRRAARLVLDCLRRDGIVFTAGAGHSLAMVCETFYRAGGLAAVRPLWDPGVLPLSGAARSSAAEREPGRGRAVLAEADPAPPDLVVVFSTSGRNPYPVEIAREALARGVPVVAVTSAAASAAAADRSGTRLAEHATVVLDTGVPAGDVIWPVERPRTAAVSTVLAAYLWASLLAEVAELARMHDVDLPLWTSSNVPGGDERNAELMVRYAGRVPQLRHG